MELLLRYFNISFKLISLKTIVIIPNYILTFNLKLLQCVFLSNEHNDEKIEFDMKIKKSYQHDPLGRQCAEAVWIRNVEPFKRIIN